MKVFVAGHNGMVGSAICRELQEHGDFELIQRTREDLDLINQEAVARFFNNEKPNIVILVAAKVGGINANNMYPAEFIYENLQIQNNVIHQSHKADVQKLLFLGSSCIYPKKAEQPMHESALLTGSLERTNEPYAIAKIAGIKMCESYNRQYGRDYRSIMPTNLYGPGDNFHLENGHVVPALIRRFHEAKEKNIDRVVVWGSGLPRREFLYVDDLARASLFVLTLDTKVYSKNTQPFLSHINIGSGKDVTIKSLAESIKSVVGFEGEIIFDLSKPDGHSRKLISSDLINRMGWQSSIELRDGLSLSYDWFLKNQTNFRVV